MDHSPRITRIGTDEHHDIKMKSRADTMLLRLPRWPVIGLTALFLAGLCVETWQLVDCRSDAMDAARVLSQRTRELRRLDALDPAPTAARASEMDKELADAEEVFRALQAGLAGAEPVSARPAEAADASGSRPDPAAAPDLADLIRGLHEQARRAGVKLRPEEQFGLSAIGAEAPTPESTATVRRQFEATKLVVETLVAARPAQLISMPPARPQSSTNRGAAMRSRHDADAAGGGDWFEIDARRSVRVPGLVETTPIRLTFVGRTSTLRRFLAGLGAGNQLVAISEVRAEPAETAQDSRRGRPAEPEPVGMLFAGAQSRFTITVEYCELAARVPDGRGANQPLSAHRPGDMGGAPMPRGQGIPPADSGEHPEPGFGPVADEKAGAASVPINDTVAGRLWPEPAAQARGRGWIYEVFTPPSVFYDRRSRALAAIPPDEAPPAGPDTRPLDVQLIQVRRGAFRLQLVGYAGGRNDLCGIFADAVTGETVIGRAGDRLTRHRVRLKQLDLGRSRAGADPGAATGEPVATATLLDETTGDEVALTTRGPSLAGSPLGVFASRKTPGAQRESKAGESFACSGLRYRVQRLELDPPLAVVECLTPEESTAGRQILTPQTSTAAVANSPDASRLPPQQRQRPFTRDSRLTRASEAPAVPSKP